MLHPLTPTNLVAKTGLLKTCLSKKIGLFEEVTHQNNSKSRIFCVKRCQFHFKFIQTWVLTVENGNFMAVLTVAQGLFGINLVMLVQS